MLCRVSFMFFFFNMDILSNVIDVTAMFKSSFSLIDRASLALIINIISESPHLLLSRLQYLFSGTSVAF